MSVTARTTVTIDVQLGASNYGPEWTVGDIRKQVERETKEALSGALRKFDMKIVSELAVRVIIYEPEAKN